MPISVTNPAAQNEVYATPFVGPINHTAQKRINVTALTNAEVDANGFLKPGVPFAADGTSVGAAEPVFGINIEPVKVAEGNTAPLLAAASAAFEIALATICQVNRDIIEDNLGRVLTANEIAGFSVAGSTIKLL